jgi:predicted metal-dependent phosphoesterase TrpH
MRKIELHVHSRRSVGNLSINAIIQKAHNIGVEILSITDYDVLFFPESSYDGEMRLISGIEFYSKKRDDIKILGYDIKYSSKIEEYSKKVNTYRKEFFYYVFKSIKDERQKALLKSDFNKFMRFNENNTISTMFDDYQNSYLSSEEIIYLIHDSGGVAVLSNPFQITDMNYQESLLKFKDLGIDGVECYHPYIKNNEAIIETTRELGLKIAGGSAERYDYNRMGYCNGKKLEIEDLSILETIL